MTRMFRYCVRHRLDAALQMGWIVAADLGPTHGTYACLVEWICDCPAPWFNHATKPVVHTLLDCGEPWT